MGDEERPTYTWGEGSEASYLSDEAVESGSRVSVRYPSGDSYVGTFTLDKKKDHGTYTMTSEGEPDEEGNPTVLKSVYEGYFGDGGRTGLGKMTFENGEVYYGIWANDKPNGRGSYSYSNGDVYSGSWAEGRRSGKGTYKYAKDGSMLVGDWENDKLVRGNFKVADGTEISSFFNGNIPVGLGLIRTSKHVSTGMFVSQGDDGDEISESKWASEAIYNN